MSTIAAPFCPDFFIVGAPKCGTTALYSYLSAHPRLFMPAEKEPHYFAPELSDRIVKTRTIDDYRALFADAPDDALTGEASVFYLYNRKALQRILAANPKARFIAMIRNPVDMCVSQHLQLIKSEHENCEYVEEAWDEQEARRAGQSIPKQCDDPEFLQYRDVCALGTQIEDFFSIVPAEQRMVIVQDDFKQDPQRIYHEVLAFLGLPSDSRATFPVINKTTGHSSPLLEKRLARIRSEKMGPFGPLYYFIKRAYIYWIRPRLFPAYQTPPPRKPAPAFYARLRTFFADEISLLERLLARDFSHWRGQ